MLLPSLIREEDMRHKEMVHTKTEQKRNSKASTYKSGVEVKPFCLKMLLEPLW